MKIIRSFFLLLSIILFSFATLPTESLNAHTVVSTDDMSKVLARPAPNGEKWLEPIFYVVRHDGVLCMLRTTDSTSYLAILGDPNVDTKFHDFGEQVKFWDDREFESDILTYKVLNVHQFFVDEVVLHTVMNRWIIFHIKSEKFEKTDFFIPNFNIEEANHARWHQAMANGPIVLLMHDHKPHLKAPAPAPVSSLSATHHDVGDLFTFNSFTRTILQWHQVLLSTHWMKRNDYVTFEWQPIGLSVKEIVVWLTMSTVDVPSPLPRYLHHYICRKPFTEIRLRGAFVLDSMTCVATESYYTHSPPPTDHKGKLLSPSGEVALVSYVSLRNVNSEFDEVDLSIIKSTTKRAKIYQDIPGIPTLTETSLIGFASHNDVFAGLYGLNGVDDVVHSVVCRLPTIDTWKIITINAITVVTTILLGFLSWVSFLYFRKSIAARLMASKYAQLFK